MNAIRICLAGAVLNFGWVAPAMSAEAMSGIHFHESGVKLIATMQQHCSWVSKGSDNQVRENLKKAGFQLLGPGVFGGGPSSGARAYVASRDDVVVIVFRGTLAGGLNYFQNVATDARPIPRGLALGNAPRMENAKVHNGFQRDYNKLRPKILEAMAEAGGKRVFVTGHSLGAALATICAFDLSKNYSGNFASISSIVSGSPRVGDEGFQRAFSRVAGNHLRVAIHGDPVTNTPGKLGVHNYTHVGRTLYITSDGDLIGSNLHDDAKKRPVHARGAYYNAIAKLIASTGGSSREIVEASETESAPEAAPAPSEVAAVELPEENEEPSSAGLFAKRAAKKAEAESPAIVPEQEPAAEADDESKLSWKEKRAAKKAEASEEEETSSIELADSNARNREERKLRPRR